MVHRSAASSGSFPRSRRIVLGVGTVFLVAAVIGLSAPVTSWRLIHPDDPLRQFNAGRSPGEALALARARLASMGGRQEGTLEQSEAMDLVVGATALIEPPADPADACTLASRAVAIKERLLGPAHPRVAESLARQAYLLWRLEDYAAAVAPAERALRIRQAALPPDDPLIGQSCYQLAELRRMTGDYAGAIRLHEQAVSILSRSSGSDPLGVASSLNYLGMVYTALGDHRKARRCLEESLALKERIVGPSTEAVASSLMQLALLASRQGNTAEAMRLYGRVLAIREAAAPASAGMAGALASMGLLLAEQGRVDEARPLLERAMRIRQRLFRPDHYLVARSHADLGRLAELSGDRPEAERRYRLAIELQERDPEARGEEIVDTCVRYARFALAGGDPGRAIDLAVRAESLARNIFLRMAPRLSEPKALQLEAARQTGLGAALSALAATTGAGTGERVEQVWDEIVRSRAMVLDFMARRPARSSPGVATMGLNEVRKALPDGSAMIAYVRYLHEEPGTAAAPFYAAFVMTRAAPDPALVRLGPADAVEDAVRAWRREAGTDPRSGPGDGEARYRRAAAHLRALIWDPVLSSCGSPRLAFIVPDGLLGLVSFASLPGEGPGYQIESPLRIHYLSAERSLLRPAAGGPRPSVLAIGGVDYDAAAESESGRAEGAMAPACPLFDDVRFSPLPGTTREVEAVARLWSQRADLTVLTRGEATEAAFTRQAPGHTVLHLATHGYFLDHGCGSSLQTPGLDESVDPEVMNPLRMAGLVFAGANRRAGRAPGQDDGILTAEEIAALDLSAVRWAVLSACETGSGLPVDGEGVLGLRRGFEAAGAGTLIASLWPVEDAAARIWMEHFHKALVDGHSTVEAVREAGLATLREQRRVGRGGHPGTWGAFLASGDWR